MSSQGREKCDHYWPYNTQPVRYGDIQVTILNDSRFPDWTISEFRVCKVSLFVLVASGKMENATIRVFSLFFVGGHKLQF